MTSPHDQREKLARRLRKIWNEGSLDFEAAWQVVAAEVLRLLEGQRTSDARVVRATCCIPKYVLNRVADAIENTPIDVEEQN